MNTKQVYKNLTYSVITLSLCFGLCSHFQALADGSTSLPTAVPSTDDTYGIAPNDEIVISVINDPGMAATTTIVPLNGQISLPLVGEVSVAGKSTSQLSKELTVAYAQYIVNPIVNVSLAAKHAENVTVGGDVWRQGSVEFKPGIRLVEAILQAGGPTPGADMADVSVVSLNGEKQVVDLSDVESKVGTSSDLLLNEDDAIYVPQNTREISVVGQVTTPGSFPYREHMTILDAITLAGGVTTSAGIGGATITNDGKVTPIDLSGLILKGDTTGNVLLVPGDTVSIPLVTRTYVFGDVNKPGYYPFAPGDRVLDALNGAGGTTGLADPSRIYVIHMSSDNQKATSTKVDLTKFFKTGDISSNVTLSPGDVVYVSDKKQGFNYTPAFALLSLANFARYL